MNHILLKTLVFLAGAVVGGLVVFGIMEAVSSSSSSNDDSSSTTNGTRVSDTLQLVVLMSRHGNRNSHLDYPYDPYPWNNTDYWPYGKEQLTNVGRRQEFNLGKKLRSMYNGFLNTTYKSSNVHSCSDKVERVVYSCQLVLQGMFPPESYEVWKSDVDWQPVLCYSNSTDHSTSTDTCDRYKTDRSEIATIIETEDAANISKIVEFFYNISGETYSISHLTYFFEKIIAEETEGYTLPSELSGIYPEVLTDFYRKNFVGKVAGTDEMVRLTIGNLYEDILDHMEAKVNGSNSNLKLNYYSAHDSSIINLQIALGMPRDTIVSLVKVGSALVLELHKDSSGEFYVQVLFIDGSSLDSDPMILSLPDCGNPCYYSALVNSTLRYTNVSYVEECASTTYLTTPTTPITPTASEW